MKHLYSLALGLLVAGIATAQTTQRLPLIEGFTSNTCGPCAGFNSSYSPILANNDANDEQNAGVAVIKYQMDWPSPGNDPSNNDDADSRRGLYGVTGIPDWYMDGQDINGTQSEITAAQQVPAELEISAAYMVTGNTVDIEVEINPLVSLGNGNRVYIALLNAQYNYSGGTNGETSFEHVFRKMVPTTGGIWMPALNPGVQTFNESYTFTVGTPNQSNNNLWNTDIEIVAWVAHSVTNTIHNATIAQQGALGVEEGDDDDFGLQVFPNPANDQAVVMFNDVQNEDVTVEMFDQLGKVVFSQTYSNVSGMQRIALNTLEHEAGLYYVRVLAGKRVATNPLVIAN